MEFWYPAVRLAVAHAVLSVYCLCLFTQQQAAQHDGTVAMDGGRRGVGDGSGIGRNLVGDTAAYAG
ncbi:hypothetical protein [Stenotrophomonas sp. 57]|uniref:hypothetical protein n=1 Tax=Stenotrophomonas sp. 57 TaxID=3051119 RepID=UPI00256F371F|nr:hypothetical protein [Stenotrophomonas sp. 57]